MGFDFTSQVNPNAPRAIYLQLLDIIEEQIGAKKLAPGEMLPSENEFCDAYHISRTTVRQAFHELEQQGLIVRKQGLGTFVAEQKVARPPRKPLQLYGGHEKDWYDPVFKNTQLPAGIPRRMFLPAPALHIRAADRSRQAEAG